MIRTRFKLGTLKLRGDTDRLDAAVSRLRQDIREGEARIRAQRAALKRVLNAALSGAVDALARG